MIASANARFNTHEHVHARAVPLVLQSLISVDGEQGTLSLDLELTTRHRRNPNMDWLLRLDLASIPITHEQWHGQAHCIAGQLNLEVRPGHWPKNQERWFLRLWLRDPESAANWELVETRPLP